jgi:dephospho-CoA kinase
MIVIGLTGGIASGKSTIAQRLCFHGIEVFDADRFVHQALEHEAYESVHHTFRELTPTQPINRHELRRIVFSNPEKLTQLEAILHPIVRRAEVAFIAAQKEAGAKLCVLEIPLLFETAADTLCELTIVASAPEEVRIARAMARPGMTEATLEYILARQLPEEVRARRADIVIDTSRTLDHTQAQVDALIVKIAPKE